MSKLLLIDGDGVAYRAGFAMERTKYAVIAEENGEFSGLHYEDDAKAAKDRQTLCLPLTSAVWSRKEIKPVDEALMLCSIIIRDIRERYTDYEPRVFLSPGVGNFRDALATRAKYKGNRDAAAKPTHFRAIREYLQSIYGAMEAVGQEADDELGIGLTSYPDSICVSHDKDLLQIPGTHYNWVTKEEIQISKRQGWLNFWSQVLSGDATDNVPGIKGVGPVTAKQRLEGANGNKECWGRVLAAYSEAGLKPEDALETASLVWVRRVRGKNFEAPV